MALGPTRVSSYGCPVKANPALWCTTYTPISTQTARASFMDVRIHRPLDPAGHCKNAGPGRSLTRYCCQPSVRPTSNGQPELAKGLDCGSVCCPSTVARSYIYLSWAMMAQELCSDCVSMLS
ncbi:hypothetical protein PtA15_7A200 [Puccinia triticina]|uniref:Uncharacterized protein n=1 Tax=Puccinia triticina TaxID=208348 RepID=A0ABY7CML9_9BASI|nr:uncharacterized protein PtA15_7A200 [Puccinia triticina]WAQ86474.1 hypothetical protein PtA15_7A200 [Puccinia triticina]